MKKSVIFLLLFFSSLYILFSNELKGKDFLISENKKAFFNYYIIDENSKKIPAIEDGLLINSRIFIKDSTRRFYLRDSGKYVVTSTEDFLIIKWRVENLEFIESYNVREDYVDYSFTIKNLSEKGRLVGVYFIFDTYLGEGSGNHFIDSEGEVYTREISFQGFDIPSKIKSVNSNNQGMEFILPDSKDDKPDRVILGNWEQLSRSKKWPYIPNDGGLFSYGYYSINDSGLGLVYPSTSLNEGESTTHRFKLKFYSGIDDKTVVDVKIDEESKWSNEEVLEEIPAVAEEIKEPIDEIPEDNVILEEPVVEEVSDSIEPMDPEKEELLRMLEYVRKKKKGEDVSGYDFDEDYIMKKLSEVNE